VISLDVQEIVLVEPIAQTSPLCGAVQLTVIVAAATGVLAGRKPTTETIATIADSHHRDPLNREKIEPFCPVCFIFWPSLHHIYALGCYFPFIAPVSVSRTLFDFLILAFGQIKNRP